MRIGESFCPGVLHAVPAKDGLLVRVRIPGGLIDAPQLRVLAALAAEFADGTLEITSRANLQLRGIEDRHAAEIAARIAAAGLLPSPDHDRVRNLVTSPIAGLDPSEIPDPRPLLRGVDAALWANPRLAGLHPKFTLGVFGGRRRFSPDADDLTLEAVAENSFRLTLAGAPTGFSVPASDAVDCLVTAAESCLEIAAEAGIPARAKHVAAIPGAIDRIAGDLVTTPLSRRAAVETLLGVLATAEPGLVSIVPGVALGRLTASQAFRVADLAEFWLADLRLAPWRGIVLGGVARECAETIAGQLAAIGLGCDGVDGFRGISACAGLTGCEASLSDVRSDAVALAQLLANRAAPPDWSVNLSGCDKQCARRHGATADLIAGASGYTVKLRGQAWADDSSPASAIHAVANLHRQIVSEAAAG